MMYVKINSELIDIVRINMKYYGLQQVTDYESVGRAFESLQAHQSKQALTTIVVGAFSFVVSMLYQMAEY